MNHTHTHTHTWKQTYIYLYISSPSSGRAASTGIPDSLSLSLATHPNRSLLLAGLQGYIPYPYRAAVCRFKLVV